MATLLEMAKEIAAAHAVTTTLTTDQLIHEIHQIHSVLQQLEGGICSLETAAAESAIKLPTLTIKQAFRNNEIFCMICGKGGMKTLTRHLNQAHEMKPSGYRKEFGIPKSQSLMSRKYAETRKQIAATMDLGANLEKARAARKNAPKKGKSKKQ